MCERERERERVSAATVVLLFQGNELHNFEVLYVILVPFSSGLQAQPCHIEQGRHYGNVAAHAPRGCSSNVDIVLNLSSFS